MKNTYFVEEPEDKRADFDFYATKHDGKKYHVPHTLLVLGESFNPSSGIFYQNPIFGSEYIDLREPFNKAGNFHPLTEIITGNYPSNGQKCQVYGWDEDHWKLQNSFTIQYDSIFNLGFICDDGTVYRDINILKALQQCIEHLR